MQPYFQALKCNRSQGKSAMFEGTEWIVPSLAEGRVISIGVGIENAASTIAVQGARYPEHIERMSNR
jgi:hypothetical protein